MLGVQPPMKSRLCGDEFGESRDDAYGGRFSFWQVVTKLVRQVATSGGIWLRRETI